MRDHIVVQNLVVMVHYERRVPVNRNLPAHRQTVQRHVVRLNHTARTALKPVTRQTRQPRAIHQFQRKPVRLRDVRLDFFLLHTAPHRSVVVRPRCLLLHVTSVLVLLVARRTVT